MPRSSEVQLDTGLMDRLEQLPVMSPGAKKLQPTPEQVAALRKYWRSGRRQADICKALGVHPGTARRWYQEHIEGGKG